jgi:hypothetical protein
VREHLRASLDFQRKLARFLENHDEPRAAAVFPPQVHEAAATMAYLCPGLRFFHQGQLHGRRKRISPHLCRGPEEPVDARLEAFYRDLLSVLRKPLFGEGDWQLLECDAAWQGNWTCDCGIAYWWQDAADLRVLVVVNFAANQSQFYVRLPLSELVGRSWRLQDLLSPACYDRAGKDLESPGLFLDLPPWRYHVFQVTNAS